MNSRRFIRSSLQLEETGAEYQFSTVVALGEVQCCVAKRRDGACPQWVRGLNRSRGSWLGRGRGTHDGAAGRPAVKMRGATLTRERSIPITDEAISLLRPRMIEDLTIRTIASKTQQGYERL